MTSLPAHFAASLTDSTSDPAFVCVGCGHHASQDVEPPRGWPWPMRRCNACALIQQHPRRGTRQSVVRNDPPALPDAREESAAWSSAVQRYAACLLPLESHPGRNLLILNGGCGQLAALARARGWRVVGLDPSPAAVCRAHEQFGLDVRAGGLARHREALGRFDVVLCGNLETSWDPAALLRDVRTVLNTGGVVCVDVSNGFADWVVAAMESQPDGEAAPRNVFDVESLQRMLRACGLEIVAVHAGKGAAITCDTPPGRHVRRWIPRFLVRWISRLWAILSGWSAPGGAFAGVNDLSEATARIERLMSSRAANGYLANRLVAVAARSAAHSE